MAKSSPMIEGFGGGEISRLMNGRPNVDVYKVGLEILENYIPTVQGPAYRRPATKFVSEVKDSTKKTRLVEFEFSVTQAYILEFGDLYMRVYRDYGQVQSGMSAYELVTPYTEAQIFDLRFAQSADFLYVVHSAHYPKCITRTNHNSWSISDIRFSRFGPGLIPLGPYLELNQSSFTITPSATTGSSITLTASSGIWSAGDVGRVVRIKHSSTWGSAYIHTYTSTSVVSAQVLETFGGTGASVDWRLGVWSTANGHPSTVTFHEDRLVFGGVPQYPQRIDASEIGNYGNFNPTDTSGTITAATAYSFTLNSGDINYIRWIKSDEKGMPVGTAAGEWVVRPSDTNAAISATNVNAKKLSAYGSANVDAIQLGKATLFAQRTKRKIRELTYFYEVDGFKAQDMTEVADHIGQSGFKEFKGQKEPQPTMWACREDGMLCSMTYKREEGIQAAWARHPLGGTSDANGTHPIVESIAIIPSPDASTYDVYLIVKRWINGGVKRYIEYITAPFTDEVAQEDAFYVDCGLTYYDPKMITGITNANPAVVTSLSHGLSNGNQVRLSDITGMTELNGVTATLANVTTDTFELVGINSTLYDPYVSGGEARKLVTTISGLDHLEGQVVSIFADGAVQPTRTVSSGSITLATAATKAHIGLPIRARGKVVRLDAGAQDGTSIGKTRRMHNVSFMLHRTLNMNIGTSFENLSPLQLTTPNDSITNYPSLFTGIQLETIDADYDTENQICFEQTDPFPGTVLAIMPQLNTQDR